MSDTLQILQNILANKSYHKILDHIIQKPFGVSIANDLVEDQRLYLFLCFISPTTFLSKTDEFSMSTLFFKFTEKDKYVIVCFTLI